MRLAAPSLPLAFVLAASAAPAAPRPGALDKTAEAWLRQVHLLILPEEEAAFRALPTPDERAEFQRIFWARRDPTPATPRNELQDSVKRAQSRADELFALPGTRGAETGCGQVLVLLGEPTEVEGGERGQEARGVREQFNSLESIREGARRPETWIYRSRPDDPVSFTGGELRIAFDEACRFPEGGRVLDDLRRVALARIVQPDLAYTTTPDGRLVRLDDQVRARQSGLAAGRSDFPVEAEPKLLLRTQSGQAYAAGLVRVQASPAGAPTAASSVSGTVEARPSSGAGAPAIRRFTTPVADDGTAIVSYGVPVSPGPSTLAVLVRLADGRQSSASVPLDVPDFGAKGLKATGLVLYPDEPPAPPDPADPYAALTVGPLRLRPRFGNVFRTSDSLQVVSVLYGGATDAAGKAGLRARFTVLKDGKAVARGSDEILETPMAVASVGPLALTGFAPGHYVVTLDVTDTLSGATTSEEASFDVRP